MARIRCDRSPIDPSSGTFQIRRSLFTSWPSRR